MLNNEDGPLRKKTKGADMTGVLEDRKKKLITLMTDFNNGVESCRQLMTSPTWAGCFGPDGPLFMINQLITLMTDFNNGASAAEKYPSK